MDGDAVVRGGAPVDLRVGLLADGRDHHGQALRPRRVQQQKGKAAVAGDEAELHGYLITPRSLRSMKPTSSATSSPSSCAHLFERLRGVQLGGQQQAEGLLQRAAAAAARSRAAPGRSC